MIASKEVLSRNRASAIKIIALTLGMTSFTICFMTPDRDMAFTRVRKHFCKRLFLSFLLRGRNNFFFCRSQQSVLSMFHHDLCHGASDIWRLEAITIYLLSVKPRVRVDISLTFSRYKRKSDSFSDSHFSEEKPRNLTNLGNELLRR